MDEGRSTGNAPCGEAFPRTRDVLVWPFAQDSIWNMPIGSDAVYADATIEQPHTNGPGTDEDIIIFTPHAPKIDVLTHDAGWDESRPRCESVVRPPILIHEQVPIPDSFVTHYEVEPRSPGGARNTTPNMAGAILSADRRTIVQSQPLHRCEVGGLAVSEFPYPSVDIYGDGIEGAHGGSGLSSVGGTIRVGELNPGSVIRHALKINVDSRANCYYRTDEADGKPGFRWPAVKADSGARKYYRGTNPGVQMGTLLALKPDFDTSSLRTEPGRIIGHALQDYGAYIVDSTGGSRVAFCVEWGPNGKVDDEVWEQYGIEFGPGASLTTTDPGTINWREDVNLMLAALHYVANNGPDNIGGGGTPRQPLAPPFMENGG